jgi:mannose-1-phosphate guanylyltransferase
MHHSAQTSNRCGIVLAAGEGKRLQPFIRRLRGDSLPKQYVNFTGTRSLLQHTFLRAEKLISRERLFTVVSQDHLNFPEVTRQLSNRVYSFLQRFMRP